jgi:hypothetical protein
VSPESDTDEWVRALSSLEPPPNAVELRRNTIGDRPVASVTLTADTDGDDYNASTSASSPTSDTSAGGAPASVPGATDDVQSSPPHRVPTTTTKSTIEVVSSWPPEDSHSWSLEDMVVATAAEVATHAVINPDDPAVQRAVAASKRAAASMASAAAADGGSWAESDEAELARDVADAVMRLQGVDWPARVTESLTKIDTQAAEFTSQLQHLEDNGALPSEVQRVAVEQLLDAIGAIVVTLQGLLVQAQQEVAREGSLWRWTVDGLCAELRRWRRCGDGASRCRSSCYRSARTSSDPFRSRPPTQRRWQVCARQCSG